MSVTDETHSRIGDVHVQVQFLLLHGKQAVAGRISFELAGCDSPDEKVRTFPSEQAAKAAGCISDGKAWRAHGVFNHSGAPLSQVDYMSWDGL
jgi:hypothetical protein